jgi:fructokinase
LNVISIGEVLWDVVADQQHLGGAPFNFAAHLARLGHQVYFVSAVGVDEAGQRVLDAMPAMALATDYVSRVEEYATGRVDVSLDHAGQPDFIIHWPAAYDLPKLDSQAIAKLFSHPVDWIYFGTLLQMSPVAKRLTAQLLDIGGNVQRFYDVNLRRGCWEPSLVRELMSKATMVKLNAEEALVIARIAGEPLESMAIKSSEEFCRAVAKKFGLQGLCITRGSEGCVLLLKSEYVEAGGYPVRGVDTVGAGDAFAAAFVHGVGNGWPAMKVADFANRVAALVASRPGGVPPWTIAEAESLQQTREYGSS